MLSARTVMLGGLAHLGALLVFWAACHTDAPDAVRCHRPAAPLIVWYSPWFDKPMTDRFLRAYFLYNDSPRCVLSADRRLAPCADALVFHAADLPYNFRLSDFPVPLARKNPRQLWVLYTFESPHTVGLNVSSYADVFNATWSYGFNADFRDNYVFPPKTARASATPVEADNVAEECRSGKTLDEHSWQPIDWEAKAKSAFLLASNCHPSSQREKLVFQLQQHLSVDTLGRCHDARCVPDAYNRCPYSPEALSRYYFYLAFENSRCEHYITEKVVENAFQLGVVPVMYGARESDYAKALPPQSYVFAEQFGSVAALAAHLRHLIANRTAYEQHFAWRRRFAVARDSQLCRLCALLRPAAAPAATPFWYTRQHLANFYDRDRVCMRRRSIQETWNGRRMLLN